VRRGQLDGVEWGIKGILRRDCKAVNTEARLLDTR